MSPLLKILSFTRLNYNRVSLLYLYLKLASAGVGNVFATDIILATLMSCTRSVNSWDIIAHRIGDKLFFDKRDKRSVGGISPVG